MSVTQTAYGSNLRPVNVLLVRLEFFDAVKAQCHNRVQNCHPHLEPQGPQQNHQGLH